MTMIKRILLGVVLVILVIAMFTFAARNTGVVSLDLAFGVVKPSIPVAFTLTFAFGWLFGVICMGVYTLKLVNERRGLRRSLRDSETEVTSLRNLPLSDAD